MLVSLHPAFMGQITQVPEDNSGAQPQQQTRIAMYNYKQDEKAKQA